MHPLGARRCQRGGNGSTNFLEWQFFKIIAKQHTCARRDVSIAWTNSYKKSWLNAYVRRHNVLRSSASLVFFKKKQPLDRRPIQTRPQPATKDPAYEVPSTDTPYTFPRYFTHSEMTATTLGYRHHKMVQEVLCSP